MDSLTEHPQGIMKLDSTCFNVKLARLKHLLFDTDSLNLHVLHMFI